MHTNYFIAALLDNQSKKLINLDTNPIYKITDLEDLHVTLGYIKNASIFDLNFYQKAFELLAKTSNLTAKVTNLKLFGRAIVLILEPNNQFELLHNKLNYNLKLLSDGNLQFASSSLHSKFIAHLTIAKLSKRNQAKLNPNDLKNLKYQFLDLILKFDKFALLARKQRIIDQNKPIYDILYQYR